MDVAARATRGINLPCEKQTRAEIIRIFKEQMYQLKACLNVGDFINWDTYSTSSNPSDDELGANSHWRD